MLTENAIIRGSVWFFIGSVFSKGIHVLLLVLLARVGLVHLGIYYLLIRFFHAVIGLLNSLLNTVTMSSLRKHVHQKDTVGMAYDIETSIQLSILYGSFGVLFFFLIGLLFLMYSKGSYAFFVLIPLSLALPFRLVSQRIFTILSLTAKFKEVTFYQGIISPAITLFFVLLFVLWFNLAVAGAVVSQALTIVITGLLSIFVLKRVFPNLGLRLLRQKMIKFPAKLGYAIGFSSNALRVMDLFTVGILLGQEALGAYAATIFIPHLLYLFPTSFFRLFYSVIAVKVKNGEDISVVSRTVFKRILFLMIPMFFLVVEFSNSIISIFFSHKNMPVFLLLLFSGAFSLQTMSWIIQRILYAHKKFYQDCSVNIFSFFLFIFLSFFLSKQNGIIGIGIALFITSITDLALRLVLQLLLTKVYWFDAKTLLLLVIGFAAVGVSFLFLQGPLRLIIFLVIYISGLVSFRVLTAKDIREAWEAIVYEFVGEPAVYSRTSIT